VPPPGVLSDNGGPDLIEIVGQRSTRPSIARKYRQRYLEVLTAAARVFAERGYHAATTKHIADAIGMQQGSLYYYIKSKEIALEQICQVAIDGYVGFSAQVRRSHKPASEKLRTVIVLHLSTLDHRPSFFKVFQENRKDLGDKARHNIGRQIREYENAIEAIFRQGVRAGEFRQDLDTLHATLTLLAACNAVSVWWQVRSSTPIPEIATQIADMLLGGISKRA
jgi:TetR/AcrR family transcriptional regulator, cholesterol catabolism regulator